MCTDNSNVACCRIFTGEWCGVLSPEVLFPSLRSVQTEAHRTTLVTGTWTAPSGVVHAASGPKEGNMTIYFLITVLLYLHALKCFIRGLIIF